MQRQRIPIEDRFWSKVKVGGPDECWSWTAATRNGGYGIVSVWVNGRKTTTAAHRVAWTLTHGAIDDGLFICHRCDNPPCCNPEHLFVGTHADNMADMVAKGRANRKAGRQRGDEWRATHLATRPRGHRHPCSRFTPEQLDAVKVAHQAGASYSTLAERYDVNRSTIARIVKGKTYA